MLAVKPEELRAILGDGMTDRMWEATTSHARTCVPGDEVYAYRTALAAVFDLVGFEMGGIKYPPQQLNTGQRTFVQQLTLEAYEHRHNLQLLHDASDHQLWLPSTITAFHPSSLPISSECQTVSSEPSVTTLTSVSPLFQDSMYPFQASSSSLDEAITQAVVVKDRRPKGFEKHYPPVLGDPVWRLKNISKEGAFHWKLKINNIETVQEFLRMLVVKPDELRAILGKMTDRVWEETTKHAKTCDPGNKVYAYSSAGGTIYVNSVFYLIKVEIGGIECPIHQLNSDQTMLVRKLILEAYEHPYYLMELDKRNPLSLCRYPPSLGDSVWVLENITKEGTFHDNLEHNNIKTVQEFVRMLMVKPDELRAILGDGMTDDMWEETTKHARTCVPGDKVYVYTAGGGTIYVNSVFNLVKVEIGGIECPLQHLNWDQMMMLLPLIMEAYEQRHHLHETNAVTFDGDDATDNIALLRARFKAQARVDTQTAINNMVPNPWIIQ